MNRHWYSPPVADYDAWMAACREVESWSPDPEGDTPPPVPKYTTGRLRLTPGLSASTGVWLVSGPT